MTTKPFLPPGEVKDYIIQLRVNKNELETILKYSGNKKISHYLRELIANDIIAKKTKQIKSFQKNLSQLDNKEEIIKHINKLKMSIAKRELPDVC